MAKTQTEAKDSPAPASAHEQQKADQAKAAEVRAKIQEKRRKAEAGK
jgi:hypothetical protein